MNAKHVVALILALQVSMSLCEIPPPSQEFVDKYNELKSTFVRRVLNAAGKAQAVAAPMMEGAGQNAETQRVREFVEELQTKPEFQSFIKFMTGLGTEASPLVDKVRQSALGWYEHYLRPHVGETLDQAINNIKPVLNKYLPAE